MANALILATTHGGAVPSPLTIVVAVAAVSYILWSRTQGRLFNGRRMVVLPAVLIVIGTTGLTGSGAAHLGPRDVGFLVASVAISVVLGAARGTTIQLYSYQGALWQRYTHRTVVLWVTLIATKLLLVGVASTAGASAGGGTNSLLLSLGVSLLAEAAIVGPRAMAAGVFPATTGAASGETRAAPASPTAPPIQRAAVVDAPRRQSVKRSTDQPQSSPRHQGCSRNHTGPAHRLIGRLIEAQAR